MFEVVEEKWYNSMNQMPNWVKERLKYYVENIAEYFLDPQDYFNGDSDWNARDVRLIIWKNGNDYFFEIIAFPHDLEEGAIWYNDRIIALIRDGQLIEYGSNSSRVRDYLTEFSHARLYHESDITLPK